MSMIGRSLLRPFAELGGLALAAGVLGWSLAAAQDRRDSEAALQAVRKEINALEARVTRETASRDDGAQALRSAEVKIAAATRKLAEIRGNLRAQETTRRELSQETDRGNRRLVAEQAALARQIRLHYMAGREELFKLVLSQESPATLGRMLVYFDYYNRARTARIAAVGAELGRLALLAADTARVEAELTSLAAAQATEVAALERSRDERREALVKVEAEIRAGNAAVAKLRDEERRLAELVKRLAEVMAGFPVDTEEPFPRVKGKLAWPVQGRLAGDYGQPRGAGPVKWTGVLLEAAAGTPVRAVYHGRVAFSDWLQGLGLLMIVDHGGGYMSLYGHNEALLKARAGLYFEIRYNGEPVNPHPWIARRPAAR
jgi:septal ring factor EnvC (AmiA/AmiB activator)